MPSAICCPVCPSTEFALVGEGDRPEAARLWCVLCRATWPAWAVPHLPAAPDYRQAYDAAPPIQKEQAALEALGMGTAVHDLAGRAGDGQPVHGGGRRLMLLRQAAVLDRQARERELGWYRGRYQLAVVEGAAVRAGVVAAVLRGLDHDLGGLHVQGLLQPDSTIWDQPGGSRAYVRQEYAAWRTREPHAATDHR